MGISKRPGQQRWAFVVVIRLSEHSAASCFLVSLPVVGSCSDDITSWESRKDRLLKGVFVVVIRLSEQLCCFFPFLAAGAGVFLIH